jgi:hypothetical protein
MTPKATLRVSLAMPRDVGGAIDVVDRFYDATLTVGMGNLLRFMSSRAAYMPRPPGG